MDDRHDDEGEHQGREGQHLCGEDASPSLAHGYFTAARQALSQIHATQLTVPAAASSADRVSTLSPSELVLMS